MKKITILIFAIIMTANSAFSYRVVAYFDHIVRPGCFSVLVVVLDDALGYEQVIASGYVEVGPECDFSIPTPVITFGGDFINLVNDNTTIQQAITNQTTSIINRLKRIKDFKIIPNPVHDKTIKYSFISPVEEVLTVKIIDPITGNIDHTATLPATMGMNQGQVVVPSYISGTKKIVLLMSNGDGAIANNIIIE